MLTRIVDGIEVVIDPAEEAEIRAEWEVNEQAKSNSPPPSMTDSVKLSLLLHYIAQQPDTPPEIKALNGQS